MKILLLHREIVFGYFELRTSTHVEAESCIEAAYNLVAEVTAANYPTFQSKNISKHLTAIIPTSTQIN